MKNATLASICVATILMVVGSGMIAIGGSQGGFEDAQKIIDEKDLGINFSFGKEASPFINMKGSVDFKAGDSAEQFKASEIENLSIEIGGAEVIIDDSEDEYIYANISGMNASKVYAENDTLYVHSKGKTTGNGKVYISIPATATFKNVDMEVGASSFEGSSFTCENFDLDLGAGEAVFKSLTVSDSADFDLGAGNLTIESATLNDFDVDLGLGNLEFTGLISGNLDVDCGMGNATLNLTDSASEHNIDLSAKMGNIKFDGDEYAGVKSHSAQNNNSDSNFDIECGMGNIEINFAK